METLNGALKDLSTRLTCTFVDSSPKMTYRNGTFDDSQLADGLHLSDRGTQTLLKTLTDSVNGLVKSREVLKEVKYGRGAEKTNYHRTFVRVRVHSMIIIIIMKIAVQTTKWTLAKIKALTGDASIVS